MVVFSAIMGFQFTGFADEAEKSLEGQIATLKEVGWTAVELRLLGGKNVVDLTDEEWSQTWDLLQQNGITVVGFGGQIGNWARPITNDFQVDIDELKRVAPRMRAAGTKFLRIMSYPNDPDSPLDRTAWRDEAIRRITELSRIAEGEGVVLGHENCSGYGETYEGYLEIVEAVDSPALQLTFDTGNNSLHANDCEATWAYYEACRDLITHVHIKCAKPGEDGKYATCFPEEDPVQERVIKDLKANNYDGWFSIEPHIMAAIHAGKDVDDTGAAQRVWVEYAQRLESFVKAV